MLECLDGRVEVGSKIDIRQVTDAVPGQTYYALLRDNGPYRLTAYRMRRPKETERNRAWVPLEAEPALLPDEGIVRQQLVLAIRAAGTQPVK